MLRESSQRRRGFGAKFLQLAEEQIHNFNREHWLAVVVGRFINLYVQAGQIGEERDPRPAKLALEIE